MLKRIFHQGKNKAPGPDGYTSWFFRRAWDIVGADFTAAVRYFFTSSTLLPAFNATSITLVPKIANACSAKDYRPISCCSVIYKAITKILVERLNVVLPSLISPIQSAFIKGRSIVDNTLLVQELVKGYGRSMISPRCALKVDLQKAFDSLSWDFLVKVLEAIGLPAQFREWIRVCFTGSRFSISLNGSLVGVF
ncbi:hypothetical protein GQ457_17G001490 [Hibiscus cannabinus]